MSATKWQFIPTWVHGIEDYMTAATLPVLPRLFGWSRKVTRLFDGVAATATVQSLMTDYEAGAVKVLPMQGHLGMDVMIGAGLVAAGTLMDDEPRSARPAIVGPGLYALALALMPRRVPAGRPSGASARAAAAVRRATEPMAGTAAAGMARAAVGAGGDGSGGA